MMTAALLFGVGLMAEAVPQGDPVDELVIQISGMR